MEEVQLIRNNRRSKRAILFIWILVFLNIAYLLLCCWSLFYNYYLYYQADSTFLYTLTNRAFAVLESIRMIVNIISGVTFIAWSYRANQNLRRIFPKMRFSGFLTIFSWFIPVASWFIPYRIMRRQFNLAMDEAETSDRKKFMRSVNWWWALWIVLAAAVYAYYILQFNYYQYRNLYNYCTIVLMIISLILCRITIRMIRKYAVLEEELCRKHAAGYTSENNAELIDQL